MPTCLCFTYDLKRVKSLFFCCCYKMNKSKMSKEKSGEQFELLMFNISIVIENKPWLWRSVAVSHTRMFKMSSLTILFLLIVCLMSVCNIFTVVSVFGYDAAYWEVSRFFAQWCFNPNKSKRPNQIAPPQYHQTTLRPIKWPTTRFCDFIYLIENKCQ